tara:strand:+ start:47 stop:193 length:147 start_codon:yes stop_codon:yes gene_type:complete
MNKSIITITTPTKEAQLLRDKLINEGVLSIHEIKAKVIEFVKNNITVL